MILPFFSIRDTLIHDALTHDVPIRDILISDTLNDDNIFMIFCLSMTLQSMIC